MGDRYYWNENCIECMGKNTVSCYDAPTCLQWSRECNQCGWKDDRGYFEAPNNIIELITEKEAREKGLIMDCPNKCGYNMTWWDKENYGECIMCKQSKSMEETKNYGVILGQRDTDYVAGTLPYEINNESGDWTAYLPDTEWQKLQNFDTMACVSFSALNVLETLIHFHTGKKVNFSDRFTAFMSGTTQYGNFLFKVADSIRKDGLVLQEEWATINDMTWDTYYVVPPIELINRARKFLDEWQVNYEFIDFTKESLVKHLKQSPIQVVIPGHAIMLFTTTEQVYKYFDTYSPFIKERQEPFISALKYVVKKKPMYNLIKRANDEDTYFIAEDGKRYQIGDYNTYSTFNGKLWGDNTTIKILTDAEFNTIPKGGIMIITKSE